MRQLGYAAIGVTVLLIGLVAWLAGNELDRTVHASQPPHEHQPPTVQRVSNQASQTIVYTTMTGTAYHCQGCRYLDDSAFPASILSVSGWYRPCSECKPPVLTLTVKE